MSDSGDLGFRTRRRGSDVEILRQGRVVTTLRGTDAAAFLDDLGDELSREAQQLMARLTGNYKRGNERLASRHPRNRR